MEVLDKQVALLRRLAAEAPDREGTTSEHPEVQLERQEGNFGQISIFRRIKCDSKSLGRSGVEVPLSGGGGEHTEERAEDENPPPSQPKRNMERKRGGAAGVSMEDALGLAYVTDNKGWWWSNVRLWLCRSARAAFD
jgi:hypothetical protein